MPEKNPHLIFQKYGQTFILINSIEFLLEILLHKKGGLYKLDQRLKGKILEHATLGKKIEFSKGLIDDNEVKSQLTELNKRRRKIAHKWLTPFSGDGTDDWVFIGGGNIAEKLDEDFFEKTIELADSIIKKLIPISEVKNIEYKGIKQNHIA